MSNKETINFEENEFTKMEPYIINPHNVPITDKYINNLMDEYNVDFQVNSEYLKLFQRSMVHPSYLKRDEEYLKNNKTKYYQKDIFKFEPLDMDTVKNSFPLEKKSNQLLETLGDSIIRMVLTGYLYSRYKNYGQEGFITKLRVNIENGKELGILCKKIKLNKYILISRSLELENARKTNSDILEDSFEAFIGALYESSRKMGKTDYYEICYNFIKNLIEKEINITDIIKDDSNHKDKLLRFCHKIKWQNPYYGKEESQENNPKKIKMLYVICKKNDNDKCPIKVTSSSNNNKRGEQNAALLALKKLKKIYPKNKNRELYLDELSDDSSYEIYNSDDNEII